MLKISYSWILIKPIKLSLNNKHHISALQISTLPKVVFWREFPSKKCGEPLSWHILQDTKFSTKWRAENFVYRLFFVTKSFSYRLWFSRNNSISGATSLNSLRKECLKYGEQGVVFMNKVWVIVEVSLVMHFGKKGEKRCKCKEGS